MLDELKSKLKELAELRRDIQVSDEYIAEREVELKANPTYQSYTKAQEARRELFVAYNNLVEEIAHIIDGLYDLTNEGSDLSQYLDGG